MVETTTRDFRGAFTLIEIIVSVTIISIVVIGAMKLQDRSRDMAIYIQERGKSELDNSLFLTADISRFDGLNRSAYDTLRDEFKLSDESRELLKSIEKSINITEDRDMQIKGSSGEVLFTFYTH
ncbi:MAG: prepilin-type N-terminal cleavage/methylation domain-containing protein, partial [Epsilonproteobacteria bacterium]|nr:prepilin-type N-terminal cleavage/methylation domain-containing protein [Campylobacterota bacterium]